MAAEYLDRRQTESEHGYALSAPVPVFTRSRKSRKSKSFRSNHNELEKNRRAHLRHCFDELRRVVPLAHDSPRHTTLGLLRRARHVIKEMEECHKRKQCCLRELIQEHNCLLDKQRLVGDVGLYRRDTHTISESSSGSPVSSGSSCFSEHEGSTSDDEEHTGVDAEFDCNLNISLGL